MRASKTMTAIGVAGAGAALAATTILAAPAQAAPVTSFQVEQVLLTGDPWPVSTLTYTATTVAPGVARVTVTSVCNSFNRPLCLDYSIGGTISWLNTSTGRTGRAVLPSDSMTGSHVDLHTGRGFVTATITSSGSSVTVIPAVGGFAVG